MDAWACAQLHQALASFTAGLEGYWGYYQRAEQVYQAYRKRYPYEMVQALACGWQLQRQAINSKAYGMRKRLAQFVDSLPPTPPPGPPPEVTLPAAVLDRYVGEYASASGFTATFRRDGDKLIVKPGNNPEAALIARSQTRLQDPRGPVFEFELDGQGKVIRAFLEQQTPKGLQRMALERK